MLISISIYENHAYSKKRHPDDITTMKTCIVAKSFNSIHPPIFCVKSNLSEAI